MALAGLAYDAAGAAGPEADQETADSQDDSEAAGEGPDTAEADQATSGEAAAAEADEVRWAVTGIVNRALLIWDDGDETGVYSVDNPQDSTGVALEALFESNTGWHAGVTIAFDIIYASADTVDQLDSNGEGFVVEMPYQFGQFGHESWGEIVVGQADSASDEIDNINLAGSDAVADASVDDWVNAFFLRAAGISGDGGLATGRSNAFNEDNGELRWGDFVDGKFGGESGRFITYISPEVMGFEASAAIGQPQEIFLHSADGEFLFTDNEGGVYADAALRYARDWGDTFRVHGGIGTWRDTTEENGATEPTEDWGWGGSLAVLHLPTGLNLSVNYGTESHTDECEEPGEVSGRCRGDDEFVYVKGGIVRDIFEWGPTAFYGEYHMNWKEQNDSDEDVLRTLELDEDEAVELQGSEVAVWGLGMVQEIESLRPIFTTTQLYIGYRHYELDFDLLGEDGPVPGREIEDIDVIMAGVTIQWGGAPERQECPPVCTPGVSAED